MSPERLDREDLAPLVNSVNDEEDPDLVVIGHEVPGPALWPQILATLIVCLAPISMGMVLGFSSPTSLELAEVLDKDQMSWYGSLITVGAIAGGPVAAVLIEKTGRKTTIMLCNLPYSLGWFLLMYADGYILLYCGRLLTGLGMGMCSLAAPVYIAEISIKNLRGTLGATFQFAVVVGVLAVYGIGIPLGRRWLANACGCIPLVMVVAMLPLPETPRWYLSRGARVNAYSAMTWLRGVSYDIEAECLDIETNLEQQRSQSLKPKDLFTSKSLLRPLIVSLGIMVFQQGSGINNVIFYSEKIMKTAGFANPTLPAIILGSVQVVATGISVALMDIAGRRVLLIIAALFMSLSSCGLGLYYYLTNVLHHEGLSWLALTSILVFIIFFSLGWGPIPWLVMSEIFPSNAKGLASGIATFVNWLCAFLVTKEFNAMESAVHEYGTFWAYSLMSFFSIFFVAFLLPETKGKSLEEITEYFENTRVLCI